MHPTITDHSSTVSHQGEEQPLNGTWLSIVGLVAWLCAMVLAVAGPLFGLAIPASLVVGMVVCSGLISLLSLPRLLGNDKQGGDSKLK